MESLIFHPSINDDIQKKFNFFKWQIKNMAETNKEFALYSLLYSNLDTFKAVKKHLKMFLGDILDVKSAKVRSFVSYPLRGIEFHLKTDDIELFKSRVDETFVLNL